MHPAESRVFTPVEDRVLSQGILLTGNFPIGSTQTVDYANALNVRRGAGMSYAPFNHLLRGAEITVLEFRGGWVRIDTDFGQGWIFAGYLRR